MCVDHGLSPHTTLLVQRAPTVATPGGSAAAAAVHGASAAASQQAQQPAQQQQQHNCQIDLARSPWEPHCQRLSRVCVDQSTLIFHDGRYQPSGGGSGEPAGLPRLEIDHSRVYLFPWRNTGDDASGSGDAEGAASTDAPAAGLVAAIAARRRLRAAKESSSSQRTVARRATYEAQVGRPRIAWCTQLPPCRC